MKTARSFVAAFLALCIALPCPVYALRSPEPAEAPTRAGLEEKLSVRAEEGPRLRRSIDYDPEEVAGRLLEALLQLDSLEDQEFFDPRTGMAALNTEQAARMLDHRPTSSGLRRLHKNSRRTLADEINDRLSHPELAPDFLEGPWSLLFRRGVAGVRIAKSREVDTRPWTEARLSRAVKEARKKRLSFRPVMVEKGAQAGTRWGKELKKAYAQITRSDNFPVYQRSWGNFLEAHGISLEDVYGQTGRPRQRERFAVYVDLARDAKGFPIPDKRRKIAELRINRLDSLWKNHRVRRADTLFLFGVSTWVDGRYVVHFGHGGKPHTAGIPAADFDPAHPIRLVLEIRVADRHHAVQEARRMDTGEVVYPFPGQIRFYLDPPFENGRVRQGALLFRAVTQVRDPLWKEVADLSPGAVYATHVRTRRKHGADTQKAYFGFEAGGLRATSLLFSEKDPPLLTVLLDPRKRESLQAWEMGTGRLVFPREDARPVGPFRVSVDPRRDARGLVADAGTGRPVSNPVWSKVWGALVRPDAREVVVQDVSTWEPDRSDWKCFFFEGEPFSTSIPQSGNEGPSLQLEFLAQDPARRPQAARRMDTGEIVYPAPGQCRIILDPVMEQGKTTSGMLHKAGYQIRLKSVRSALNAAESRISFENLNVFRSGQKAAFRDPLTGKRTVTSLFYRPGISITAVAERKGQRKWAVTRVYDAAGNEALPPRKEEIARAKGTLRGAKATPVARVLAVERLSRWGALDLPNGVTTDMLQDLLFDYHGEIFNEVGAEPFYRLSSQAARLYRSRPDQYWRAVYGPLAEAEHLPPAQAALHLAAAARSLPAGAEENEATKEAAGILRTLVSLGAGQVDPAIAAMLPPHDGRGFSEDEALVRAFLDLLRSSVKPPAPLPEGLLSEGPYRSGAFSRGELTGAPAEEYLHQEWIPSMEKALEGVAEQFSTEKRRVTPNDLGFPMLKELISRLFFARGADGKLLMESDQETEFYRWVYREIPRLLSPKRPLRRIGKKGVNRLIRALENPFRLSNDRSNDEIAGAIGTLLERAADRFRDDPDSLRQDPRRRLKPWIKLTLALNLIDYSRPAILKEMEQEGGLVPYVLARLDSPFLDAMGGERYLEEFIDRILKPGVTLAHLPDNNGELAGSLKLAEVLLSANPSLKIRMILKADNGVMNDASMADAERLLGGHPALYARLRQYEAGGNRFQRLSGAANHGTPLHLLPPAAIRAVQEADLVLAEGEANSWTLNRLKKTIFLGLRLKWPTGVRRVFGLNLTEQEALDRPPAFFRIDGARGPYYRNPMDAPGAGERRTILQTLAEQSPAGMEESSRHLYRNDRASYEEVIAEAQDPSSAYLVHASVAANWLEKGRISAGAEEGDLLLRARIGRAASPTGAWERYENFKQGELIPALDKRFGPLVRKSLVSESGELLLLGLPTPFEIALVEGIFNLAEHGSGGTVEIFAAPEMGKAGYRIVVRLTNDGAALVKDPNVLLRESRDAHLYAGSRGLGFWNIVSKADEVAIESSYARWEFGWATSEHLHFESRGTSPVGDGMVLTMTFKNLAVPAPAGAEEAGGGEPGRTSVWVPELGRRLETGPGTFPPDHFLSRMFLRFVQNHPNLFKEKRAMEIGIGAGGLTIALARAGARVAGVDLLSNAVEDAARNFSHESSDVQSRAVLGVSDLYAGLPRLLGEERPRFDAVLSDNPILEGEPDSQEPDSYAAYAGAAFRLNRAMIARLPELLEPSGAGYFLAVEILPLPPQDALEITAGARAYFLRGARSRTWTVDHLKEAAPAGWTVEEMRGYSEVSTDLESGLAYKYAIYRVSPPAAGAEERNAAMAMEMAAAAWKEVPSMGKASAGSPLLVFREPDTFDLVPLAVKEGWTVAVDADGPEAERLGRLLDRMREEGSAAGICRVGRIQARRLIQESLEQITIRSRRQAFTLLLQPELQGLPLPEPLANAIGSTRRLLDLSA